MATPKILGKRHSRDDEDRVFAPKLRKFTPAGSEVTRNILPNLLPSSSSGCEEEM